MRIADLAKQVALSILDVSKHRGHDLWRDMQFFQRKMHHGQAAPIAHLVDVGANVGQTALSMVESFPSANIHSFEPFPDTFEKLKENARRHTGIVCNQVACGSKAERRELQISEFSTTHTLLPIGAESSVEIEVVALDQYMSVRSVDRVFLLKTDTEGFDMEVLEGAKSMIATKRVDYILAEVCFFRKMSLPQTDFIELSVWLHKHGYHFCGLYETIYATDGCSVLWGNALFTCH